MTLSLRERYPLRHDAEAVWRHLADIELIAECFPGASLEGTLSDGGYRGSLSIRLGPTKARFAGEVRIELDDPAHSARLLATGSDLRRSHASADATVMVVEDVGGATSALDVDVAIEISGPLSQFARAGGTAVTRTLLADFAASFDERLGATAAADRDELAPTAVDVGPHPGSARQAENPAGRELSVGSLLARSLFSWTRRVAARLGGMIRPARNDGR